MRLIDADKLLNDYQELADCDFVHPLYENTLRDIIDDAPTVEVCEDCISREAVINTIFYKADNNSDVVLSTDLMDRIKHLPSVTPKARWIPCSEKLPEKNTEVLVTTKWGCITIGEMLGNNDWLIHEGTTYANSEGIEIIAWMPLPQPYKAESRDADEDSD